MLQSRSQNVIYYLTFTFIIVMFASHWLMAASTAPITIYVAKKIMMMDSSQAQADAVAVKDHQIYAVGSLSSMKTWMKPGSYSVNRQYANDVIIPYQVVSGAANAKHDVV